MEVNLSIEKGIGIYLLFLSGLDSFVIFIQITWPLSCFIILEYITKDIKSLGYYIGILSLFYSLGKLIGYKLISYATETYNIKWVLACLFFLSSLAMISIGLFTNFIGILFSRFLSGFCSNSQQSVRKLLLNITAKQKSDWSGVSEKALWSLKIGGFVGMCIGTFLLQTYDYLPGDSKFVQKKFLLCSLTAFLFELSGLLLIFSLEPQHLPVSEPKKYVELPEIKEYKDSDHQNELQDKEKFEIQSYLQSSVLANEHLPSEESISPEDIKFYSPRGLANKGLNSRRLNSTRPKGDASFNFNHSNTDLKYSEKHEKPEGEGKRTHISFIEDEFEAIPELQKSDLGIEQNDTKIEKNVISHLDFALRYRILMSFVVGMIVESVPY